MKSRKGILFSRISPTRPGNTEATLAWTVTSERSLKSSSSTASSRHLCAACPGRHPGGHAHNFPPISSRCGVPKESLDFTTENWMVQTPSGLQCLASVLYLTTRNCQFQPLVLEEADVASVYKHLQGNDGTTAAVLRIGSSSTTYSLTGTQR